MLYRMYDAAYPPLSPPRWEVAAGYIGGNTPHVWTRSEWAAQLAPYRLPIWVRSDGGDPQRDADSAVTMLEVLGAPKGCAVALDLETRVDAAFVSTFNNIVVADGYKVLKYGSLSTIFQNPHTYGTWVADWTGRVEQDGGAVATQFASDEMLGTDYDASVIDASVPLWTVTADWSSQIMNQLPVLQRGGAGFPVNNLQAILNDSFAIQGDTQLKVDKVFGPATEARVKQVQQRHGLTPDGVCGPKTWNLLLLEKT